MFLREQGIVNANLHELFVRTTFADRAVAYAQDAVGRDDGRGPVSDHEGGAPAAEV